MRNCRFIKEKSQRESETGKETSKTGLRFGISKQERWHNLVEEGSAGYANFLEHRRNLNGEKYDIRKRNAENAGNIRRNR